jgi:hypothetical protein
MIFSNLWALFGLLGIPLLVGIHFYRHRFREQPVSGLFLWGRPLVQGGSGRKREQLRGLWSLLAECLGLLALVWFLADPHFSDQQPAVHHLVVLDGHERLLARRDDGRSVGGQLLEDLRATWRGLPDQDRITLIRSGLRPQLIVGPLATREEALSALDRPVESFFAQPVHDPVTALDLAAELAGEASGRVLLASDRPWPGLPERVSLLARGQVRRHCGLVDARWWRDAQGERLHLNLVNAGPARQRELLIETPDGTLLQRLKLALPADGLRNLTLPLLYPPESLRLRLAPDTEDQLPIDDQALLLRPRERVVTVFIDPSLAGLEPLQRVLASLDGVQTLPQAAGADLIIGGADGGGPEAWHLSLGDAGGPPQLGPFLARRGRAVERRRCAEHHRRG